MKNNDLIYRLIS